MSQKLTLRQTLKKICLIGNRSRHDPLAEKVEFVRSVYDHQEDGKVALVTSGMDCDCSSWTGRVFLLPAVPVKVNQSIEKMYESAEGPITWHLTRPSMAQHIRETNRDLALEAFEDGHPHVVYV